ncbi:MAG: hypothetical protein KJN72_01155 [Woeseia sp.]|nr:hypothetical protein [Woeseia sp.]
MTTRIMLLADEAAGLRALRAIAKRDEILVAVLAPTAESQKPTSVANVASGLGYDVIDAKAVTKADLAEKIRGEKIDILINVHLLHIIHPAVIAAPRLGCFNLHPGPLPEMAGLNVPSWAVFRRNKSHSVTLHWMAAGIDTGPIVYAENFEIDDTDTGLSVMNKCVVHGIPLIDRLLDAVCESIDSVPAIEQDLSNRELFMAAKIPNDGRLDWSASAREIDAFVRAADYGPFHSPWGFPVSSLGDLSIGIRRVRLTGSRSTAAPGQVVGAQGNGVLVAAADEVVLLEQVVVNDKIVEAKVLIEPGQMLC